MNIVLYQVVITFEDPEENSQFQKAYYFDDHPPSASQVETYAKEFCNDNDCLWSMAYVYDVTVSGWESYKTCIEVITDSELQ